MKKAKLMSLLFIMAIVAVSCKKETGPAGPQGNEGPAGPAGTANVIYSSWVGFDSSHWGSPVSEWGQVKRIYSATAPGITQSVIDRGAVLVYFKLWGTPEPSPLPIIANITLFTHQYLGFRLVPDTIQLTYFDLEDNNDPGTFTGDSTTNAYRYVIIPGGIAGNKSMTGNDNSQPNMADLRKMTYSEVCAYFKIPE
jgi:hypothetical protein